MNLRNILTIFAVALYAISANAQVIIGSGNAPHSFSVLELINNDIQGFRLPQMYECERDAMEESPEFQAVKLDKAVGLMIFNLSNGCVEIWRGSYWISLCYGEDTPCSPFTALTHNPTSLTINNICFGAAIPGLTVTPVRGTAPFTFQWFTNTTNSTGGTKIVDATIDTFTPNSSVAGTRFYYAIVSNCEGNNTMTSDIFAVTVHPALHTPPFQGTRANICAGTTPANINLGVSTGGSGTFTYQWMRSTNGTTWTPVGGNVQNLAGSTIGALNQTTFFYRRATNDCGTTTSAIITQTVHASFTQVAPTATINTGAANGGTVTITLTAVPTIAGVSAPTYQWRVQTQNNQSWRNSDTSLGISAVASRNANLPANLSLSHANTGGWIEIYRSATRGGCTNNSPVLRINFPAYSFVMPARRSVHVLCNSAVGINIANPTGTNLGGTGWGHRWYRRRTTAPTIAWTALTNETAQNAVRLCHTGGLEGVYEFRRRSWRTGAGAPAGYILTGSFVVSFCASDNIMPGRCFGLNNLNNWLPFVHGSPISCASCRF